MRHLTGLVALEVSKKRVSVHCLTNVESPRLDEGLRNASLAKDRKMIPRFEFASVSGSDHLQ